MLSFVTGLILFPTFHNFENGAEHPLQENRAEIKNNNESIENELLEGKKHQVK